MVRWPATGREQVFDDLAPGRAYRLVEGELRSRPFKGGSAPFKRLPQRSQHAGH
jgi:hypothetical protein